MKNIYKMVKKGKFKLFSYIVEENLIYYKSLNKNKRLVAFLILEVEVLNSVVIILNDFLKKSFVKYYSIQVEIKEKERTYILINLEDDEKSVIVKMYNIIRNRIIKSDVNALFLKNKRLEKQFLGVFFSNTNMEYSIQKKNDSILIKNDDTTNIYQFYSIQLDLINNTQAFLDDFVKIINNFTKNGFLIFNFRMNFKEGVVFTPYFVNIENSTEKSADLGKEINIFFNLNLLKKQSIDVKSVASLLWRNHTCNCSYLLKIFVDLFTTNFQFDFNNLSNFNAQFEQSLSKRHISFKRLNLNLLFINQNSLFIAIMEFNSQTLLKLLKKFHSKYFIFLFILDEKVYKEVLKIDKIDYLSNIKVINSEKFLNMDFEVFKRKKLLENPQINSNILS